MIRRTIAAVVLAASVANAQATRSGNPIIDGWYADPEAHVFEGQYWIYPTYSAPYNQQTFLDAFSSRDLLTWTRHPRVLDTASVKWAKRAVWAPSIIQKDGWYYLFFGANDIQSDSQPGGIGVARARSPQGPFVDHIGHPLVDRFHNGAQPIDQFVFRDKDGAHYLIYGGWRHCNIARLNDTFTGFVPFPDGSTFKEITPAGYVEGPYMFLKDDKYYFMWSEGGWTGPNYAVAYAVGSTPFGPFERVGKILQQDSTVATGAGHHSVLHAPGSQKWYIVYHRRPLGETDRNHRVVSIDEMRFDARGMIEPVVITKTGVAADPLPARTGTAAKTVLFVGNSFLHGHYEPVLSYNAATVTDEVVKGKRKPYGGIPAIFKTLTGELGLDYDVHSDLVSGKTLQYHYDSTRQVIVQPKWDVVVMHDYSTGPVPTARSGNPERFARYADLLEQEIHGANAKADIYLYETWPRADLTYPEKGPYHGESIDVMAKDLHDGYSQEAARNGHFRGVAPAGDAWMRAIRDSVAIADPSKPHANRVNLWGLDSYHPSIYGAYLNALVLTERITGKDVRQLGAAEQAAAALGVAPDVAVVLQRIAHETLRSVSH